MQAEDVVEAYRPVIYNHKQKRIGNIYGFIRILLKPTCISKYALKRFRLQRLINLKGKCGELIPTTQSSHLKFSKQSKK